MVKKSVCLFYLKPRNALPVSEALTVKAGPGSPLSAGLSASEWTLLLSSARRSQNGFVGPQ